MGKGSGKSGAEIANGKVAGGRKKVKGSEKGKKEETRKGGM